MQVRRLVLVASLLLSSSVVGSPVWATCRDALVQTSFEAHQLVAALGMDGFLREEFGINGYAYGGKFSVQKSGKLILKRLPSVEPQAINSYLDELARTLFATKIKQQRYTLNPQSYTQELLRFTSALNERVDQSPNRFGPLRYMSTLLWGWFPDARKLWASKLNLDGRIRYHFLITRMAAAFYLGLVGSTVVHLPDAYETLQLVYRLSPDFIELGDDLKQGMEIDRPASLRKLLAIYQAKLQSLLDAGEPLDADKKARLEAIIASLKDELDNLAP